VKAGLEIGIRGVYPTHVGVNRDMTLEHEVVVEVYPTHVGVNRITS